MLGGLPNATAGLGISRLLCKRPKEEFVEQKIYFIVWTTGTGARYTGGVATVWRTVCTNSRYAGSMQESELKDQNVSCRVQRPAEKTRKRTKKTPQKTCLVLHPESDICL